MSTEKQPSIKIERIREFIIIVLQDDFIDLGGIPVKETAINLGLGLLMILVTILHFTLAIWQFVVSLLLVGYDGVPLALGKIPPKAVKENKVKQ